ncbi:protein of unknown function UPF0118 [Marinithermus hydrothermalis DSM 14884]|uniref:Permease n=2 Tax=Marinithermus TaxID=186191 RepID=F2NKN1_MARHT|nr:protein of unknown function UPF0118 [Marinithermus hydrothermalis DSM 14884]
MRYPKPMRDAFQQVWANPYVRVLAALLGVWALYQLLARAQSVWTAFVVAYVLAYLANPLVCWLERFRVRRVLGVVVAYALLFLFLGFASVLVAEVVGQLSRFARDLPALVAPLVQWVEGLPDRITRFEVPPELERVLQGASASLQALLEGFANTLLEWLRTLLGTGGSLIQGLAGIVGGLFQLFIVFVLTAYMLLDFPRIGQSLIQVFPRPYQPLIQDLAAKLDHAVGGYVRGQLLIAALVGTVVGLGLFFLGVPLAAALGFIAGVFNLVPYLGVIVSIIPALLLALPQGGVAVVGTLVVFILANQLEAHLFSPLILSRATQLHPVTVILAILAGATLFGLWGAVLAVPFAAFLKVIFSEYYLNSRWYENG